MRPWALIAIVFAAAAASTGLAAGPAAPNPAESQRTPTRARLGIEIGPASDLVVEWSSSREDRSAVDDFQRDWARYHACFELQAVKLGGERICDLVSFSPITDVRPVERIIVEGDRIVYRARAKIATERLFDDEGALLIEIDPGAPMPMTIHAIATHPYVLKSADPLPGAMDDKAASYRLDSKLPAPAKISLRFRIGEFDPRKIELPLRGPPSLADRMGDDTKSRLFILTKSLLKGIGIAMVWLLPILLTFGLVRSVRRDDIYADLARRAERLCLCLGTLPVIGIMAWGRLDIWEWVPDRLRNGLEGWAAELAFVVSGDSQSSQRFVKPVVVPFLRESANLIAFTLLFAVTLRLLALVTRRMGWRAAIPRARILRRAALLVLLVLAVTAVVDGLERWDTGSLYPHWPYQLYAAVGLAPHFILLLIATLCGFRMAGRRPGLVGLLLMVAALLALLMPLHPPVMTIGWGERPAGARVAIELLTASGYYLGPLAAALSFGPLAWLLWRFRQSASKPMRTVVICAGGVAFGLTLSGPGFQAWWGVAAVLVATFVVWPKVALAPRHWFRQRRRHSAEVESNLPQWVAALRRAADLKAAARASALNAKLGSGDLTADEWTELRDKLEAERNRSVATVYLPGGVPARDLVLGFGAFDDPWERGLRALRSGTPVIVLLAAWSFLQISTPKYLPMPMLFWSANILQPIIQMGMLAFLFGYFFPRLRGGTGLHKALNLAAALSLAEVILWVPRFSGEALAGMVWTFSQHFLLLIPIGVIGFDYARMRSIEGPTFDWRRFTWFGDPRLLSTGLAATAAALTPVLATIFSGPFADAVKEMVTVVAPVVTPGA